MQNLLKKVFGLNIFSSIMFFILGLFLIFRAEGTISLISSIIGIILILNGGFSLIQYFRERTSNGFRVELIYGIIAVIAGFVLILNPEAILSVIPFILGIYFVGNGIMNLKYAIDVKSYTKNSSIVSFIIPILMILCGVLLIANPFGGVVTVTKLIGIFLVVYSAIDMINYFYIRKGVKELEKIFRRD